MSRINSKRLLRKIGSGLLVIWLIISLGQNFGNLPLVKDKLWTTGVKEVASFSVTQEATPVTPPTDEFLDELPGTISPAWTPDVSETEFVSGNVLIVGKHGCPINPTKNVVFTFYKGSMYANQCTMYVIMKSGATYTEPDGIYAGKIEVNGLTTNWWKYETISLGSNGFPAIRGDDAYKIVCSNLTKTGEYFYPYCK